MCFSGFRGAMAFSLALKSFDFYEKDIPKIILTTTLLLAFINVILNMK